nr:uncharacterized protein LOC120969009 [Aegilops tauschii subsp. strangulata]
MAVVDKAEADLEERVAEVQAWFRQAHKDLKAAQDVLAERKLELVMKQADIEKAEELAKQQAAQAEPARHQQQAALNSQEEDLELEQKHEEALNAQTQVHTGKVKELEVERDKLKRQALELIGERDAANGTLADAQAAVLSKAGLVSTANESIKDLKLKLESLEGMLSKAKARIEARWPGALDSSMAAGGAVRAAARLENSNAGNVKKKIRARRHGRSPESATAAAGSDDNAIGASAELLLASSSGRRTAMQIGSGPPLQPHSGAISTEASLRSPHKEAAGSLLHARTPSWQGHLGAAAPMADPTPPPPPLLALHLQAPTSSAP